MSSKAKILVVLAVIVSLVLAACAGLQPVPTPTPSVTVEELIGIWRYAEPLALGQLHLQVNKDGTYRFARTVRWLETSPKEVGRFRLEGTLITFIGSSESKECAGQSGSYEVELTEEGQLRFVLQEDPCQFRVNYYHAVPWERVEP